MKIAALDIGGTSIKAGIWQDDRLTLFEEYDTEAKRGGPYVMEKALSILKSYEGFDRIGISTAGQVDSQRGSIRYANENIPNYTGMAIKEILSEYFKVPVAVENDVNAAAIGEAYWGAGKGYEDFLCLTYGTGIGGAIVINQKIYTGAKFSAGEFGSMITHGRDRVMGDEMSGCYERYASTTALVRKAKLFDEQLTSGKEIFRRIDEPKIQELVGEWLDEVVYGLVNLIHIFNPSCVVLGGGIMAQPYILEALKQKVNGTIMPSFREIELKAACLGNQAGLLGAVKLATQL